MDYLNKYLMRKRLIKNKVEKITKNPFFKYEVLICSVGLNVLEVYNNIILFYKRFFFLNTIKLYRYSNFNNFLPYNIFYYNFSKNIF